MSERKVIAVTGSDRIEFLQGLVTNTVPVETGAIAYSALLTPQGKFIADFFVLNEGERILIDVAVSHAAQLAQRLSMYRLRADVKIDETDIVVSTGAENAPDGALSDPRHEALGWRHYGDADVSEQVDWNAIRVTNTIPETGIELTPDIYILEAGFERLNGVNFKKGCFVGQEIVARMKHKATLNKGIVRVAVDGSAKPGDEVTKDGKPVGVLHSIAGGEALAFLRFNRAKGEMQAGDATITRIED